MKNLWRFELNLRLVLFNALCLVLLTIGMANAAQAPPPAAVSLRSKYVELAPKLSHNQFARPLYLDSAETPNHLTGDIYAEVQYPFATVEHALDDPTHWCDLLILHINTKYCRATVDGAGNHRLAVNIGKKDFQELDQTYRLDLAYRVVVSAPDYFDITLAADQGPLGTSDYRIQVEGTTLSNGKSFVHLHYSYSNGVLGEAAMQVYLATVGRGKVGFSQTGVTPDAAPVYIDGVRGAVERNTMRYYLAIDAYLSGVSTRPADQFEKRLLNWFTSSEVFSRQLHDVDQVTYLDIKRREYRRQLDPSTQ